MKTIVAINSGNVGSTGRIMMGISKLARSRGYKTYQAYPKSRNLLPAGENDIIISSVPVKFMSTRMARYTGLNGCYAWFSTQIFLRKLDKIRPDIIHLHNLHDSYINLPMLFHYIKKNKIKVIWTLHDCWTLTGHCALFTYSGCDKWKTGCGNCPQLGQYPSSKIDTSAWMWKKKREWFTGVEDLTICTPSKWLSGLVSQSYLRGYPCKVINNGIDLKLFRPIESDFREQFGISGDKIVLLGVAFGWGELKGLDVFIELARRLPKKYVIVLVGTSPETDKVLPEGVISIHRTNTQEDLVKIYSAADLFVNPTREDNFPTVNIESLACGLPVLTFDTNGSPEILDETCGAVVPYNDVDAMESEILRITRERPFSQEACIRRSRNYDREEKYEEYLKMYR